MTRDGWKCTERERQRWRQTHRERQRDRVRERWARTETDGQMAHTCTRAWCVHAHLLADEHVHHAVHFVQRRSLVTCRTTQKQSGGSVPASELQRCCHVQAQRLVREGVIGCLQLLLDAGLPTHARVCMVIEQAGRKETETESEGQSDHRKDHRVRGTEGQGLGPRCVCVFMRRVWPRQRAREESNAHGSRGDAGREKGSRTWRVSLT